MCKPIFMAFICKCAKHAAPAGFHTVIMIRSNFILTEKIRNTQVTLTIVRIPTPRAT